MLSSSWRRTGILPSSLEEKCTRLRGRTLLHVRVFINNPDIIISAAL